MSQHILRLDNIAKKATERYKFGFNGMEKDNAVKGEGNSYDFGARIFDARLGRWMSRDPLGHYFPNESPYVFVGNSPLIYIDVAGLSKYIVMREYDQRTKSFTEMKILVDDDLLEAAPVTVDNASGHDTHTEWDYYDIYEVHTTIIDKDGNKKVLEPTTERGEKRAHTWYKSQWWANKFKDKNEDERDFEKGLVGIRWTTASRGSSGQGNSVNMGRRVIRSENIDMLMSVLGLAKSGRDGAATVLREPSHTFKEIVERIGASHTAVSTEKEFEEMFKEDTKAAQVKQTKGKWKCQNAGCTKETTDSGGTMKKEPEHNLKRTE